MTTDQLLAELEAMLAARRERKMGDYKVVPVEPTPEMVEAAEEAHMPFGDMDLALRMAILAAPAVQGEPVGEVRLELGAKPYVFAELYSKSLSVLAPGTKLYAAPQPAPDMVGLVEALRTMLGLLQHKAETPLEKEAVSIAETAIAAHRKQGGEK